MLCLRPFRALLVGLLTFAFAGHARSARACIHAAFAPSPEEALLASAREALEKDDVTRARTLGAKVASSARGSLADDGRWIEQMGWVRDPDAPYVRLEQALRTLGELRERRDRADVRASTDLGEALARAPGHEVEAWQILRPLAQRDLIGDPHAYAALGRLARARAQEDVARMAVTRCGAMGGASALCELGAPPPRPWIERHAPALFGALGGTVAIAAAGAIVVALARRRRRERALAGFAEGGGVDPEQARGDGGIGVDRWRGVGLESEA